MKNYEILDRDPRTSSLANGGQARINDAHTDHTTQELRSELETFVCDGQYGNAIERILRSYLTQLDRSRQKSCWVSGFFGSGKSHLLKMLGHLWVDTVFEDGATARSLVPRLPDEIKALFQELDIRASRTNKSAVSIAGTLLSQGGDHVRLAILSIIFRACGMPVFYAQAQFCFWLKDQGYYSRVRAAIEAAGKNWFQELNNLYSSGLIANAVLACDPFFASNEGEARQVLRVRFPKPTTDISEAEFIEISRKALASEGELPLTVLILDEVQQYINDSQERAGVFADLAEAIQTKLDSRVMLVASGQAALSTTPLLQKIQGRFIITAQLSDTDVEAVTRQVLLLKKPCAIEAVRNILDRNAGEVSKHLLGTRIAERQEDRNTILDDYPLLPSRRRFWEECFRVVDAAGLHSQLRSQLRILDDALNRIANSELGTVIPSDALFDAIAPDLVNNGTLLNEIDQRIRELDDGSFDGKLKRRICGIIFLINKLPREAAVDVGVRATSKTLADLLVENLDADSGPFRRQVNDLLEAMAAVGTLMKVGDEYRLQTTEGAEWDNAFREKAAGLRQRESELEQKRDQLLAGAVQRVVNEIRITHGEAKLRRGLSLHAQPEEPTSTGDDITVWLRDGWSASQRDVENGARRRGQDDPVIHAFIPRNLADELRGSIVEAEAARKVLDQKGAPGTREGQEARDSMNSRLQSSERTRDSLVRDIISNTRIYQGGGNEVFGDSLRSRIEAAAEASKMRLFPRFIEGDHGAWESALRRAREGSDQPFTAVNWDRPTEDHPVAREALAKIGNGAKGSDVGKTLRAAPYGWPQDAIDATLIALTRVGSLRATANGQPVAAGQLDQNRIRSTEFRLEKVRLGATEKIALRGLYQKASVPARAGEEELKAGQFLQTLSELADAAGGDPPMPACPDTQRIDVLKRLTGTEQLGEILKSKSNIENWIDSWATLKQRAEKRKEDWTLLSGLLGHAEKLPVVALVKPDVDAIIVNRSLLSEADQIAPIRVKVATALRAVLTRHYNAMRVAWDKGMETLKEDAIWSALEESLRNDILSLVGLVSPNEPSMKTDEELLKELDNQTLDARADAFDAFQGRLAQALAEAARRIKPSARRISLKPASMETVEEVKTWLIELEKTIMDAIANGPVIIG